MLRLAMKFIPTPRHISLIDNAKLCTLLAVMADISQISKKPSKGQGAKALAPKKLHAQYHQYESLLEQDPFVNPVVRLSFDIGRMLDEGKADLGAVEQAISAFALDGLERRAQRFADYLGSCDEDKNRTALKEFFRDIAASGDGQKSLGDFQALIEHVFYGFVFTAHPTFSMSNSLAEAFSAYSAHLAGASAPNGDAKARLEEAAGLPYTPPDIHEETRLSLQAIERLHGAVREMLACFYEVAAELYPAEWTALRPRLCSIATWVGFDMDGRMDIQWATTFEKRIELQVCQLRFYKETLEDISARYDKIAEILKPALEKVKTTLTAMEKHHAFFEAYNQNEDEDLAALQAESRDMIASAKDRLLDAGPLVEAVQAALAAAQDADDNDCIGEILVLRAQLDMFGLSCAEVHFRINANQVHNAIGQKIAIETHPDHPAQRRVYIDKIAAMLEDVSAANIDFGDIAGERMTAKYEFMLIQQIVNYIDRATPIRFLIAETESAFTMLTALYYAKRFGVAEYVDICPLFETGRALQGSARYVQTLLDNPVYHDYLKARGRICIQTGYSDAGRYLGQPGAGASIERLKERFARMLEQRGESDIGLLFFDTHGESVGRGGHPESFESRLRYISSPHFLDTMARQNRPFTQESSYQGGDGYLHFLSPASALAVVTRALTTLVPCQMKGVCAQDNDPYYQEPYRSKITAFFTDSTTFQSQLLANDYYPNVLGAFSTNIMHPSGSRAVKRSAASDKLPDKPSMRQFRAIPHNAILGQFGLLANTVSGMGRALRSHSDLAEELEQSSERFRCIMALIDRGFSLSNSKVMRAYISLLDPTFWSTLAGHQDDSSRSNRLAAIGTAMEKHDYFAGMMEIYRLLDWDCTVLKRYRDKKPDNALEMMACLHALRLALMQRMFLIAADIPRYGPHHTITRDQLMRFIFQMDIDRAVAELEEIFPDRPSWHSSYNFGEPSDYREQEDSQGYVNIREKIIKPLRRMQKMNRDISAAIAHYMGFFG